jgi:4'-phosphopantetheinyl transferase
MSTARRRQPLSAESPAAPFALGVRDVHVWTVGVASFAPQVRELRALLDEGETARAARFYFDVDRNRYVVSHGVLRLLLGRYLGREPAALRFGEGEFGKPHLLGTDGEPLAATPLSFNLSHSGDVVVVALSAQSPVGVDVERWSRRIDADELGRIAEYVFSPSEQAAVLALSGEERLEAFFAIWSRKEAYIKASGIGVSYGLDQFDVTHARGDARLLGDRRMADALERWMLHDLTVPAGYSGAVATDACCERLVTRLATPDLLN